MAEAPGFVEFFGEYFEVPDRINKRLVYQFLALAKAGASTDEGEGAQVYTRLLSQCVKTEDLARFDAVCDRERAEDEELLEFLGKVLAAQAERPTKRSSASSVGSTTTVQSGEVGFSSSVSRLEAQGRPDLALLVTKTQAARSA